VAGLVLAAAGLVLVLAELTGVLFVAFWLGDAVLVAAPLAVDRLGSGFIVSTGLGAAALLAVVALCVEDAFLSAVVAVAMLGEAGFTFGLICTGVAVTGLVLEVAPANGWLAWANAVPEISTTVANWIKFVLIVAPLLPDLTTSVPPPLGRGLRPPELPGFC